MLRRHFHAFGSFTIVAALVAACDRPATGPAAGAETVATPSAFQAPPGGYDFAAAVFDIAAAPNGGILVAENTTVREIGRRGIRDVGTVPLVPGAPLNGLAAVGQRSIFATSGGLDLAVGAGVWHVTGGGARQVADIHAFETQRDPDALEGPRWKDQRCEEDPSQGFTAGPQSNPYHLAMLTGSKALVADAAGNTLLMAAINGVVDWVAVFTPPVDANGDYRVLFELADGTDCFVQPVPTSVAVGPDGAYYVGELTGATPNLLDAPGLSRVWRIEPGSRHVTCPSAACQVVVSGLTSIVDVAFGPDEQLYVAEMDENGWLRGLVLGDPAGGTINRCDVASGTCTVVAGGLAFPGAITFDKDGQLWLLENGVIAPTVRTVSLP